MKKGFLVIGIIIIISIAIFLYSIRNMEKNPNRENIYGFEKATNEFLSGNYSVIVDIPKEYYIRPDFYPNYNPNESNDNRKAMYGYGVYPSEVIYSTDNVSANQDIDIYVLIFASTGVYSYQGIGLDISSPDDKLFKTHIDPNNILLSPKYLDNSSNVSSNWTYKLKMIVTTNKDTPKGEYVFTLKTGTPSPEKDMEYNKINGTYISGSPIQPSKLFDFILKVK